MGTITWNTDVNAPCAGEIVGPPLPQERDEFGRFLPVERATLLIQTDWDYPGTARSFGWSMRSVQRCPECGKVVNVASGRQFACPDCERIANVCDHDSTDGTVDCPCGMAATDFISVAGDWLRENDGATADDPGYFEG